MRENRTRKTPNTDTFHAVQRTLGESQSKHIPTEELFFYNLGTYYPVKIKVVMPAKHVQSQQ